MADKPIKQDDRREYYRFKESLMMSYVIAQHSEEDIQQEQTDNQYAMNLLAEFSSMSQHIKLSLGRMSRSPEASNCFKILDAKINLLAQTVLYQDKNNDLKRYHADISAGGISFTVDKEVVADTILKLQLVLAPELQVLNIQAKVIACKKNIEKESSYTISTQFLHNNEFTEDLIVRHIMHCQSDQLRSKRDNS
ncbi:MAG: PilZ domain-containing protein [Pseudomonadota bacterium]